MTTNYQRTAAWLAACGKQPGNPQHISTQIGADAEEMAEYLACLRISDDGWQRVLERIVTDLGDLARTLLTGKHLAHIPAHLRVEALDGLSDREVTANGVAFLLGFDKDGADQEVLRSNESKLDADGKPIILPGGKVGKSIGYSPPKLAPFAGVLPGGAT